MIRSHRSLPTLIFVVILFSAFSGYAQPQQEKTTPEKEENAALREKAFKLLESVASQLGTLQSAENRARMGSNLVESFWKHDEERARSLLRSVQEEIRSELQRRERPNPDTMFEVFLRLRLDTVERVAKHDAEAALEFLKVTEPVFEEGRRPYNFIENERGVEMRLAKQVAVDNPDVALQLARRVLNRYLSADLLLFLRKLNRKHPDKGQTLYKEIVAKVRESDFDDWQTRNFSQSLVRSFTPPEADESTYRELISFFVTKALDNGCGRKREDDESNLCAWLLSGIRDLSKYDSRAASLKHWTSEEAESERPFIGYEELQELLEDNALDQLEEIASKHPGMRSTIYSRVIEREVASGNYDQARKLIGQWGKVPELQEQLLAYVDYQQKRSNLDEKGLHDIQMKLTQIKDPREQVRFLTNLVTQLAANRKEALKLLNQANDIAETMKPGKEQTESRLLLAIMYSYEKDERGFAMMESLVPKLNELVDVAVRLDGYDTNYLRDGEWNMSANGSVGTILTRLSERAGHFAWYDFDRAVSLASQFERPEIRMMAHLKLAQSILAGPPKPFGR